MCTMLLLSDSYNLQLTQNNAAHSITIIAEMPNLGFHKNLSRGFKHVLTKSQAKLIKLNESGLTKFRRGLS